MKWILALFLVFVSLPARADSIFVGAGDIATCSSVGDDQTAALLDRFARLGATVFSLGDHAYPKGTADQFANCYGSSWGRHKAITKPTTGNHEYMTPGAAPYLEYFGYPKNYSYLLGNWHVISFDSMCQLPENGGSCAAGSPAMQWLASELAKRSKPCTLVLMHHPRWSSGGAHGNTQRLSAAWDIMYDAGVDVVLSAHDHSYERFAPLTPDGQINHVSGIRSFVVGTGGASLSPFGSQIVTGSEVRNASTFGVLRLTLRKRDYSWRFVAVPGSNFVDSGTSVCH